MSEELKDMLLRYLQDMTERGDYTAKKLLALIEEEEDDR
jgi:FPC/CPF motif-containing protein YcgG